jgi:hypothetical protein
MVAVNGPSEFAVWLAQQVSGATVKNNALYDHGNGGEPYIRVESGASGLDIGFNSISKSDGVAPVGSPYSTDLWMVSPQFVSLANGDFHLLPTSPLVDSGSTLAIVPVDFDGVTRPQGPRFDIGAYELVKP